MSVGDTKRSDLPTGTVTFLFTDIEGSTRLLDALGDRYPPVLEAHQRILRDVFRARGGVDVSTEGDSFFVVFSSAPQAVAAAVAAQRAIAAYGWPEGATVRVRMGIHTGEGLLGGDNYVGVDLHRASRIAAVGHGGQIVLSDSTRALVGPAAPEGITFRDLGEHRLRDLPQPEHLFQAVADGLVTDFPALRSMDARPNNLPVQLTTFVGRRRELESVKAAVREARLLTLTGPGGTGKTRLALQAAAELLPELEDGVFFVPLAAITEPSLVMPAVVQALGLPEATRGTPADAVVDHLRDKELLLVADNFEQVLDAAPEIGQILTATDRVRVLATSREPLGLSGEREFPVPPLGLPDPSHLPSLEGMSQFEAVALFIERARAVTPDFQVTNENAPAVAEICARLDGLPLAIELAAARVKILSPQAMLTRLKGSLTFLSGGSRDLPQRQRTLRDAIAWSFDLLDPEERRLFSRLAAFMGGFTLEEAERICNPDGDLGIDTFEGVASLTNKSLLRQMATGPEEPRFFMLETIREFAVERLDEGDDGPAVRRRHLEFFADLAGRAASEVLGPDQVRWLDELEREHENFRAALAGAEPDGEVELGLKLAAALWRFWQMRGHLREGRARLEHLLALPGAAEARRARADALEALGGIRYWMGAVEAAREAYEECLAIRRELGDDAAIAEALYNFAFTLALPQYEDRDPERAIGLMEEALAIFRRLGDRGGIGRTLWGLGNAYHDIDFERSLDYFRDALPLFQQLGDRFMTAWSMFSIGYALNRMERHDEAEGPIREALHLLAEAGDTSGIPLALTDLALVAVARGERERALRLAGAAAAMEQAGGVGLSAMTRAAGMLRNRLVLTDDEADRRAWAEGEAMDVDQAVAYALEDEGNPATG